jgi:hypothetical protein
LIMHGFLTTFNICEPFVFDSNVNLVLKTEDIILGTWPSRLLTSRPWKTKLNCPMLRWKILAHGKESLGFIRMQNFHMARYPIMNLEITSASVGQTMTPSIFAWWLPRRQHTFSSNQCRF